MQQAKIIILVRPESYINDVANISLINNKANIKGTCNKDDINILARACVRACARARVCVCARARVRVCACARACCVVYAAMTNTSPPFIAGLNFFCGVLGASGVIT